ncbi:porin (plasmid) [Burkholderia sp. PAMC 28687]|uniref:porin n=1 Tax=Burkholderia sp. PAMC 28687 TaxID=1795874 RepID=UPI000784703C|nr:porin [Burkholderia sp. PAMC 28687]AMM18748.1 porin [Burkholderia sp. PAMC 28687]
MRKTTGFLAPAVLAAFVNVAYAQSNVTLYGVLDEGMNFINNVPNGTPNVGARKYYLDSTTGMFGSRWGMKGIEDLGGGLKAVFTLESGINLNNGAAAQGGLAFGRQALVGLSSASYGSITLGRQYDMVVNFVQPVSMNGYFSGNAFQHPGDIDNLGNTYRTNNTIKYASPSFSGLTFGAETSIGGVPGNASALGGYSLGAGYARGPLTLGAGYMYFKDPDGSVAPNTGGGPSTGFFNGNGTTSTFGSLNSAYQTATAYQVVATGGTYALGSALIGVAWSNVQYGNLQSAKLVGKAAHFNDVEVGVRYTVTPSLFVGGAYNYTKGADITRTDGVNVGNQHYNQFSLMADYSLSKRTDVYVQGAFQQASGKSSTGANAVANIANFGDSSTSRQTLVRLALRQKF